MKEKPIKNILLAEDKILHINEIIKGFEKNGIDVKVYPLKKIKEIYSFLKKGDPLPDLILLDLSIEKRRDGFDVLDKVKKDKNYMIIPVIILSRSKNIIDIKKGYKKGANSYIIKPSLDKLEEVALRVRDYWIKLNAIPENIEGD